MTHSLKVSFASIAFAVALLLGATSAFAAVTVQDIGTLFDGKTSTNVDAGDEFTVLFTADATSGDEIEYVRTRVEDQDGQVIFNRCTNVGRKTGNDVEIEVEASTPSDTPQGNLDILIDVFGMGGVAQVDGCSGSSLDGDTFEDRVRVGDNTQDGQSGNGGLGNDAEEATNLIRLICQTFPSLPGCTTSPVPPTSTVSANCKEYASLSTGLWQGSDTRPGGSVGKLQSFLMYKGFDIPLLSANKAPYGFFGPQTASAAASFKAANSCI